MDYLNDIPEYHKLQVRHQVFLKYYLFQTARNGTKAALLAAYAEKSARTQAVIILKNTDVQYVIKQYDKKIGAAHELVRLNIIKELSMIAFSDVKAFMSWTNDNFKIKASDDLEDDVSRIIAEVSEHITMFGASKKIKLHDKLGAIKELNKMMGWYAAEKVDLNNPDGNMGKSTVIMLPSNGREK